MIKTTRVLARNVRAGDVLLSQLSVRVPQTAKLFSTNGSNHIFINKMKFDPDEVVKIDRTY